MKQYNALSIAIAAVLASTALSAAAAPGDVARISQDALGNPGDSYSYSYRSGGNHFSADGRYVVFWSEATNLGDGDTDGIEDIHVYDRQTGTVELVSRAGANGAKGNNFSQEPTISADGRYVAFQSHASNLGDDDTDGVLDIHVYDRQTGTVELVSRAGANGPKGDNNSFAPTISADGRYVAFLSFAANLGDGDTDTIADIHVYDRQTGTVELVSRAGANGPKGDNNSFAPTISADGRYVAFLSFAANLGDGDTDGVLDIHVYDRQAGTVELVSRAGANGPKGDNHSNEPAISADGRYVAFRSLAANLGDGDTDTTADIHVYDRQTGTVELVSRAGANGPKGDNHSNEPAISVDGRYVAFQSHASNLGDGDTDGIEDIHVYDRQTGTVHLMSARADGTKGNSTSLYPAIAPDGTLLAFSSFATNLAGPQNFLQVFVKETGLQASGNVVLDTVPPTITCPTNITGTVGQTVNLGTPTVSDLIDAAPSVINNAPTSFGPGATTVTWTATDDSGNPATCQQTVNLTYNFQGFFQPVDNLPVINTVKNGSIVPVKWRLLDASGAYITDTAAIINSKYTLSTCGGAEDSIEETTATGGTGLRWDSTAQQFVYNWKTPALAGKCVQFTLSFNDGTSQSANFKLK
jgi:Tol biopolymer transport system component